MSASVSVQPGTNDYSTAKTEAAYFPCGMENLMGNIRIMAIFILVLGAAGTFVLVLNQKDMVMAVWTTLPFLPMILISPAAYSLSSKIAFFILSLIFVIISVIVYIEAPKAYNDIAKSIPLIILPIIQYIYIGILILILLVLNIFGRKKTQPEEPNGID